MKTNNLHGKPALVAKTRWLAYATAGAATALTSGHSAEAAIHYSGLQNVQFGPHQSKIRKAPLDQAGDYLVFAHGTDGLNHYSNFAGFSVVGIASAAFAGSDRFSNYEYDVFRLPIGTNISANKFIHPYWSNYSRWGEVAGSL